MSPRSRLLAFGAALVVAVTACVGLLVLAPGAGERHVLGQPSAADGRTSLEHAVLPAVASRTDTTSLTAVREQLPDSPSLLALLVAVGMGGIVLGGRHRRTAGEGRTTLAAGARGQMLARGPPLRTGITS